MPCILHNIYSHYYRFAFNSPFVRNTGTFTVGYRILLQGDTGYFYSGIQYTFTGDTGYFYRGIQDTVTGGYRILYQVDIGYFYGVLLQWDTKYFLQGDTGYFYRVIQDTYKFETRHRLIITFKKSAPPPIPIPHFS